MKPDTGARLSDAVLREVMYTVMQTRFRDDEGVFAAMRAVLTPVLEAQWQPMETAPKDGTALVVLTKLGSVVKADWRAVDDFVAWVAVNEGEYPPSWDDGVCWESNAQGEPSDPPVAWMPLPASPAAGDEEGK